MVLIISPLLLWSRSHRLLRGNPDKTGCPLAQGADGLAVAATRDARAVRAEDHQTGLALADHLEQGLDRPRAADAEPLDLDAEAPRERARPAQGVLDVLAGDIVQPRQRHGHERGLHGVDDEEGGAGLDRRVDAEPRSLRVEGYVERGEQDRARSRRPRRSRRVDL